MRSLTENTGIREQTAADVLFFSQQVFRYLNRLISCSLEVSVVSLFMERFVARAWDELRPWLRKMVGLPLIALTVFWLSSALAIGRQTGGSQKSPPPPRAKITIEDGTELQLRFVQPIWGPARRRCLWCDRTGEAKPGDHVRLVAVTEVRINETVVIAKGALARATVRKVWHTDPRYDPGPGLDLKFDSVNSVNGIEVPLRASKQGKAKDFRVKVLSKTGGTFASPDSFSKGLIGVLTYHVGDFNTLIHERNWVPLGTLITAFVQGATDLDAAELQEAQTRLPLRNPTVMLTVFRTNDHNHESASVSCDGKPMPAITSRQYTILELQPGPHSCTVESGNHVELMTESGEEYFLRLRPRMLSVGWELDRASQGEGEDGMAQGRMVTP